MKRISLLGSTGSIGTQTIEIVDAHPDQFHVVAIAAGRRVDILESQIRRLRPELVAVPTEESARDLRARCADLSGPTVLSGTKGLEAVAAYPDADIVISAIVGAAGLAPTLAAIHAGKTVGLANKESLVAAGRLMIRAAKIHGAHIIPVDSEHSAVYQCLAGRAPAEIRKIILTASGGSLRNLPFEELDGVSVQRTLQHPNWSMGRKITVDSATLMNKGLEVIEAHWLFDLPAERIDVVVHPQSIIHSLVEFVDGTLLAQMSHPDMKAPIGYALAYPGRMQGMVAPLDLAALGQLTFEAPSSERYPCLGLAYEALRTGGTMPAVMNSANEIAVEAFLKEKIRFTQIASLVEEVMSSHVSRPGDSLQEVREAMDEAESRARQFIGAA